MVYFSHARFAGHLNGSIGVKQIWQEDTTATVVEQRRIKDENN